VQKRAFHLMKTWCDTLLSYQVHTHTHYTDGALLCPACHVIHGRIADLCFPLTVLWAHTKKEQYLLEADKLIDWSEANLQTQDGLWYNDMTNRWYGISAFSSMAIGESLYHFGSSMPPVIRDKWQGIFIRMVDALIELEYRESFRPVVNYFCGIAAVLAMAYKLTKNQMYEQKAEYWLKLALEHFDKEGILYGEGPMEPANDGSNAIDMGYNLEESIPLLLRYAVLTGKHEAFFRERLRDHLNFLLPDGGIDNSFGSRHNKWTYWGSRTSDGLVEGLALVMDDPMFADACNRVLTMYENCTHDGLLAMPMAHEAMEPTCLHHTFTHAKALAALVCAEPFAVPQRTVLPGEEKYGIKSYQNGRLLLASYGPFRATFSACNMQYLPERAANAGGSMNLLYHENYGIVCAATSAYYTPTEPLNQQYLRNSDDPPCMTAQFVNEGRMACMEKNVRLERSGLTVKAGTEKWQAEYTFDEKKVTIKLASEDGDYHLPIVCSKDKKITVSEDRKRIDIDGKLTVCCDVPICVDPRVRVFNQVGGLMYVPLSVHVQGRAVFTIE